MRLHVIHMKTGITRTLEFERKKLGEFAVNASTRCGHDCTYCSSTSLLRRHPSHKANGEDPFIGGYATVDPDTPVRVELDARRISPDKRGTVILSTFVDSWAPEARNYNIGPRCLKAILSQPKWTARILSKSAAVAEELPFLLQHRERVLVGLSITGTADKTDVISVFERNASPVRERIEFMLEAHRLGLRTYAMFCPLLPGIADAPEQIDELVQTAVRFGAEEIFVESLNHRGKAIGNTAECLLEHGYLEEFARVDAIRSAERWSQYTYDLLRNTQRAVRKYFDISKLRFLLYPSRLVPACVSLIGEDDAGVIWLGKSEESSGGISSSCGDS